MLTSEQSAELALAVEDHLAGRLGAASPRYERLRAQAGDDFQVVHLLGVLRHQQGRPAEALPLLHQARRLMPRSAPTTMCYGLALDALGRHEEAEQALRLAVNLDPRNCEGWANLGAHYTLRGMLDKAFGAYSRSLEVKPDYPQGWSGLGVVCHLQTRNSDAIRCHTRALEIDPQCARARFGRAQSLQACHRVEEAIADFDADLALQPDHHEARSFRLFLLNYRDDLTRESLAAEHFAYGRAVEPPKGGPGCEPRDPSPRRRLRVGFLSPDFRGHSVAYFIEPLLTRLDREQFEVCLYYDHFSMEPVTERLRAGAAIWRQFAGQANETVERAIRADAPDILVDLAGHTGFNRMEVFARRVAPVQITYLGYPNTTGLTAMDYRFTDEVADPEGEGDELYTERRIRFAPTAWAYQPPADAPEPRATGKDRPITFGSFNALSKVNGFTLRLWREVLDAIPGSRLVLKSSGMDVERWRDRLAAEGIGPERSELLPMSPSVAEHLACYGRLDIALDPFPYQGTTTTCEALWMGVPVVSLSGDRHSSRVGASLLRAVGRPEWAAKDRADYVRIAAGLAADANLRGELRLGLRQAALRSDLLDHAGQARRFGDALRRCWLEKTGGFRR